MGLVLRRTLSVESAGRMYGQVSFLDSAALGDVCLSGGGGSSMRINSFSLEVIKLHYFTDNPNLVVGLT